MKSRITYQYLTDLKAAKYEDSAELFSNLYAWKAKIIVNNSKDDFDKLDLKYKDIIPLKMVYIPIPKEKI